MRVSIITAMVVGLSAGVAWPCSGEVCNRYGELALTDGGLPSNFPLVVTDLWHANSFVTDGTAQVFQEDGTPVLTQARVVDWATAVLDTSQLVVGERYRLQRTPGCAFSPTDAGTLVDEFVVAPALPELTQGVRIEVEDAGTGMVRQYAGAACSEGKLASFATFRFVVDPAVAPALPFYGWRLALQPSAGGSPIEWRSESVGAILADGRLRSVPNEHLAPRRISTVFHSCEGHDMGVPPGRYRAVLSGRLAASDAGFESTSDEFELLPFIDCGADAGVEPVDAGLDAGSGAGGGNGAGGGVGGGAAGAGAGGGGGGTASIPDGGVLGPSADRGCSVSGGSTLLLLAVLALRRRR